MYCNLVPMKARRQQIPWSWSYREFWATYVYAGNWSGPLPEQWVLVTTEPCLSSHFAVRVHIGIMGDKYKKTVWSPCKLQFCLHVTLLTKIHQLRWSLLLFFPFMKNIFSLRLLMCVDAAHTTLHMWLPENNCQELFYPSTLWVSRNELRLAGLAAGNRPCWDISPAPLSEYKH